MLDRHSHRGKWLKTFGHFLFRFPIKPEILMECNVRCLMSNYGRILIPDAVTQIKKACLERGVTYSGVKSLLVVLLLAKMTCIPVAIFRSMID